MQHRAEHLLPQLLYAFQFDQRRRDEMPARPLLLVLTVRPRRLKYRPSLRAQSLNVALNPLFRFGVNQWPDVGGKPLRVAHAALRHRTTQHRQRFLRHLVLHVQQPQGGAALTGAVERRGHHIRHHLLGKRRRIDNHRVYAAGFGDKRRGAPLRVESTGQRTLQLRGDGGGAGKHHPAHPVVAHQRRADGFTRTRQQLQRTGRHPSLMQNLHRLSGNQRGLFRRFSQHAVAGRQRRRYLPGENRQWKVPRADAHHRTQRAVVMIVEGFADLSGVVTQEIHRFAHFRNRVRQRLARLAHQQSQQVLLPIFQQIGGARQNRRPLGSRRGEPDVASADSLFQRQRDILRPRLAHVPHHIARFSRVDHRAAVVTGIVFIYFFHGQHRLRLPRPGSAGQ